jgi:RNA recognition motif-containing protein
MATRNAAAACPGEGPPQMRKLFIGGLSHETTDEQLRTYFSQWGPVVDAIVIRDQTTKQSRGFGFVTFATINSAEAAMLDRPHVIGGKTVDSKRAIPREQMAPMMPPPFFECDPAPGCKLLLSGIHWDFHTVEALRLYFEKFGSLDQIEGNPRGVGFVIYEDKDSADKCLAHNGGRHIVNDRKVEVRRPMPSQTYWRRPRPQLPLFDQMAGMTLEDTNKVETFEDESNYEGTTTEDDCKSSEHSSSALDTDSPSSNQSQ